jgi:hypothetical protein
MPILNVSLNTVNVVRLLLRRWVDCPVEGLRGGGDFVSSVLVSPMSSA